MSQNFDYKPTVAPLIVPFTFGEEAAFPGDSNAVNCMIMKGDLPLDIHWTFNGHAIRNGERGVTIVRIKPRLSSLSIDSLDGSHRGMYGCVAANSAGTTNSTAELLINGVHFKHGFHIQHLFYTFRLKPFDSNERNLPINN